MLLTGNSQPVIRAVICRSADRWRHLYLSRAQRLQNWGTADFQHCIPVASIHGWFEVTVLLWKWCWTVSNWSDEKFPTLSDLRAAARTRATCACSSFSASTPPWGATAVSRPPWSRYVQSVMRRVTWVVGRLNFRDPTFTIQQLYWTKIQFNKEHSNKCTTQQGYYWPNDEPNNTLFNKYIWT